MVAEPPLDRFLPWRIAGRYFESCNCDAVCPCRMVGAIPGGRSTHGICYGVLSWLVDEGAAGATDLAGLAAAFTVRYDDDEAGSPWRFVLHVDAGAAAEPAQALGAILSGELGGEHILKLPWVRKPSERLALRSSAISIDHEQGRYRLEVGAAVSLQASRPVEGSEPVRCGIPGYHEPGVELYADSLRVDDEPYHWELAGNCAFASTFDYSSA